MLGRYLKGGTLPVLGVDVNTLPMVLRTFEGVVSIGTGTKDEGKTYCYHVCQKSNESHAKALVSVL